MRNNKTWELLAPVGSMDSLYAAVENGADAVYLGTKQFSARAQAANFDLEELKFAIRYCHLRGVKLFVTVNTLYKPSEISRVIEVVDEIYRLGVDSIIVQDLGLTAIAAKRYPDMEIHASTQMFIHNYYGAKLLEEWGLDRVVVAREMSLTEINRIYRETTMAIEGFIHGALCVCYSGQCLMSSMIGGRSGNRGRCAQPCRKPYHIVNWSTGKQVGDEVYYLSPRDLNSLDTIKDWHRAGVYSFKIEGRMKRPEYVATVVDAYRSALNHGLTDEKREEVEQIFNRKFTKGLAFGDFGQKFISGDKPNNRGVMVGKVLNSYHDATKIKLTKEISPEDGLALRTDRGMKGVTVKKTLLPGEHKIPIPFGEVGSAVYRTSWQKLLDKAKTSYQGDRIKENIRGKLTMEIDAKPRLEVLYEDEKFIVEGEQRVEKAQKAPLTKERIREQLNKMGDSVFLWEDLEIDMDEHIFYPISQLNEVRRNLIEELEQFILLKNRRIIESKKMDFNLGKAKQTGLRIQIDRAEQLADVKNLAYVDRIYLDNIDREEIEKTLSIINGKCDLYVELPWIMESTEMEEVYESIKSFKDRIGVCVKDLGALYKAREIGFHHIHGEAMVYVTNKYAADVLLKSGLTSFTASLELNEKELNDLSNDVAAKGEVVVHGDIPVMVMKNCPMAWLKNCKDDSECQHCEFASGYGLKDQKGEVFRIKRKRGITELFNSHPLYAPDIVSNLIDQGWQGIRVNVIDQEDVNELIDIYYGRINRNENLHLEEKVKTFIERDYETVTRGHLKRGVE